MSYTAPGDKLSPFRAGVITSTTQVLSAATTRAYSSPYPQGGQAAGAGAAYPGYYAGPHAPGPYGYGPHDAPPALTHQPPWAGVPHQPPRAALDPEAEELAVVVSALRRVAGNSLQAALEAGEIIFRHVFRGDEGLLKARGKKCSSFRKLASHPDLAMSSSSLWRAVAIYELASRFPELVDYVHTGVGHISVVLGLPTAQQFQLLRKTEAERWTRRKLQKVVAESRIEERGAGVLPTTKLVERLEGLALLAQDVTGDRQLRSLQERDAQRALATLARIRDAFDAMEAKLCAQAAN